jgi:hypothetical protein
MRKRWIGAGLGLLGLVITAILIITLLLTPRGYRPQEGDVLQVLCPRITTG